MGHYFRNLLTAICGRNPYHLELVKIKVELEKAADNVSALIESYYNEMQKAADAEKKLGDAEKLLAEYETQMKSYQTLVENYRDRLKEKDTMIDDIRKDHQRQVANYEKRVGDYSVTIAKLQEKVSALQDAKEQSSEKQE